MSPTQFNGHQHTKRDINGLCPSPLKITRDSHFIKKSPPSSSTSSKSSGMASTKPQPRHPVIIYTHSPKIIHTHPRDFMALVQKLTGLSRSDQDDDTTQPKPEPAGKETWKEEQTTSNHVSSDDSESSSVITDEFGSSVGDVQVNSSPIPPLLDPPNPCFSNIPVFGKNPNDFLCSNQPFYNNYTDSLFLMPNMRSSISFSSTLEDIKECREF